MTAAWISLSRSTLRLRMRLVAALALLVAAEVEIWAGVVDGPRWIHALIAPALALPLAAGDRWPIRSSLVVLAAATGDGFVVAGGGEEGFALVLAVLAAMWTIGGVADRRHARLAGLAGLVLILTLLLEDNSWSASVGDVAFAAIVCFAPWFGGASLRRRSLHVQALEDEATFLEREQAERARAAVEAERARIARELHDVIAHSVSVMTLQAGAARMLLHSDPEAARAPIATVEETGREALAETRRLLGVLRADMAGERELAPQPGMDGLGALIEQARAAGLEIDLVAEGEPRRLPPGIDLAAFRVVQEGLTNVRKHSTAGRAAVRIAYHDAAIELEIVNDGVPRRDASGSGQGLVGMRERVALYNGTVEAGPEPDGGYAVRVTIPTDEGAP